MKRSREHIGEQYVNVQVPKDDANYGGPWDCAEFISWLIYQEAGLLYGCVDDSASPSKADAYTGAFRTDLARLGRPVSIDQAASTVGGILLRYPPGPGKMGHIALCDGRGGTVEAKGARFGVVADTVQNRHWDTGILIPGISYGSTGQVDVVPPSVLYWTHGTSMDRGVVTKIQTALLSKGFNPGQITGDFDTGTESAVAQFQEVQGLTVDGQVGPETASALDISLLPDALAIARETAPLPREQQSAPTIDPAQLVTLISAFLTKDKTMPIDPSKPTQTNEVIAAALPLLLQLLQSGKTAGSGVTPILKSPDPVANTAPGQRIGDDQLSAFLALILQQITGKTLPIVTDPALQTTTVIGQPAVTKPSVQLGAAGLGIASLLQAFGVLAPPFSTMTNSTPPGSSPLLGTLATVIPLVVAGFGATSGWSTVIGIAGSLFSALGNAAKRT